MHLFDVMAKLMASAKKRGEFAEPEFKFVEVVYKFVGWMLTLVAVTLAARASHLRVLEAVSVILPGIIVWPIGKFFSSDVIHGETTTKQPSPACHTDDPQPC